MKFYETIHCTRVANVTEKVKLSNLSETMPYIPYTPMNSTAKALFLLHVRSVISADRITWSSLAHESVYAVTIFIFKFAAAGIHLNTHTVNGVRFTRLPSAKSGRTAVEPVLSWRRRVWARRRVLVQTNPTVSRSTHKRHLLIGHAEEQNDTTADLCNSVPKIMRYAYC